MSRLGAFFISISMAILLVLDLTLIPSLAASSEVSVDESASGTQIQITPGDTLKVTLSSSPSTGFSWIFTNDNVLGVLQLVGHVFEPSLTLGGNGKDIWTFSSGNLGTAHISLEYSQPWEGGTKRARTFELWLLVSSEQVAPIPATSNLSTGLMIVIFASVIAILGMWRSRLFRTHKR